MLGRFRRLAVAAGLAGMLAVSGCGSSAAAAPRGNGGLVVRTSAGMVRGSARDGARSFQGIPFAQPPVGGLRWRPPEPVRPWRGVRPTTAPGPACAQSASGVGAQRNSSEDCLYLNVTAPRRPGPPRPVMVWLYGGGFTAGAGAQYDPTRIVTQGNVVVVTINYRLGSFGFFGYPGLGAGSGDFGLLDQVAALRWVRRNAAAFGGDPGNVTLFGESAGAFSTCDLLTSPSVKGLVDKAIMESSSCSAYFPENAIAPGLGRLDLSAPLGRVQAAGATAAARLGCGPGRPALACLRRVPAKTLEAGEYMESFSTPAYGTPLLPGSPAAAFRRGRVPRIPVLFGTNRDELRLYVAAAMSSGVAFTAATRSALLRDNYGPSAPQVATAYPIHGDEAFGPALSWAAAVTDDGFGCPTVGDAAALSRRQPVYSYVFADENAPNDVGYPAPAGFPLGAAHGLELPLLFGPAQPQAGQRSLARTMIGYWTDFARTGDPNGEGLPRWPAFSDGGRSEQLAPTAGDTKPVGLKRAFHCDLWRSVRS